MPSTTPWLLLLRHTPGIWFPKMYWTGCWFKLGLHQKRQPFSCAVWKVAYPPARSHFMSLSVFWRLKQILYKLLRLFKWSFVSSTDLCSELQLLFALLSMIFVSFVRCCTWCALWRGNVILYNSLQTCWFHIAAVIGLCCRLLNCQLSDQKDVPFSVHLATYMVFDLFKWQPHSW